MVAMYRSALFLLAVIAGCLFTPYAAGQGSHAVQEVPFKNGVEVKINGQGPFRFGLDTGSSVSFILSPELAHQLSLPVTSHTHMHSQGDRDSDPPVDVLRIDSLQLAGHSFQHAIGVGYSNSSPMLTGGQGTLGIALFQSVVLKLDYPGDRLSVSDASLPDADGKRILTYKEEHMHPIIPVVLGGIPVDAKLDSGARGTGADVMIPFQLASQLHLVAPMRPSGTVRDIVGNSHEFYTATLDGDLTIGDLTIHHPTLLISDSLPYVNLAGIVNRLAITLDPRHHTLQLEMPAER
jgi:hypothetical protein